MSCWQQSSKCSCCVQEPCRVLGDVHSTSALSAKGASVTTPSWHWSLLTWHRWVLVGDSLMSFKSKGMGCSWSLEVPAFFQLKDDQKEQVGSLTSLPGRSTYLQLGSALLESCSSELLLLNISFVLLAGGSWIHSLKAGNSIGCSV